MYCKHFMTLFGDLMNVCIIGQSKRLSILENNLKKAGYLVNLIPTTNELNRNVSDDIIILPIPTIANDGFLNIGGEKRLSADEVLSLCSPESLIISCGYKSEKHNIIDLNTREDFALLNAVPTAEGAICYALENTERSLFESKVLITGFGRVAKLLADRLKGLCPNITVAARSSKDLSYAEALSFKTMHINNLKDKISGYDLVFQTVPSLVISTEVVDNMSKHTVIIELSSKSKGTDYKYAETQTIKVVHAPALPEKISPITAGNILSKSVLSIISERKSLV